MLSTKITSVRRGLATLLIGAGALFCASSANAILIDIEASPSPANLGDMVTVDLNISDLGAEVLSSFDVSFLYDETILDFSSATFSTELDPFGVGLQALFDTGGGEIFVSELSLELDSDLSSFQSDAFTFASLSFDVIGEGFSDLSLAGNFVGLNAQSLTTPVNQGGLQVGPVPVPEPAVPALLLAGGLGMFLTNRRRRVV